MAEAGHHAADPNGAAGRGTMPGMATTAQRNDLRQATGGDVDQMFLQLMFRHHAGEHASVPAVRALANQMAFHQREESQTILALLRARGLRP